MATAFDSPHRLTVEEYLLLAERSHDELSWENTELIEGVIYDVSPESALHRDTVEALHETLKAHAGSLRVHSHGSIQISATQMWAPDVYIVKDNAPNRLYPLGADLALAVEVAVSTQHTDLGVKLLGYAEAAVPEYWVIEPRGGRMMHRFWNPSGSVYVNQEILPYRADADAVVIGLIANLKLSGL